MAGYDPKQPRDDDGEWTIAGNSARKAAGLEPKYSGRAGFGNYDVYMVEGGQVMSDSLLKMTEESFMGVRVIYNSETNTWHITSHELAAHGNFENQALEGAKVTYTEQVQARGSFDPYEHQLIMYDFRDYVSDIIQNNFQHERMVANSIERTRKAAERNVFSYYDESGKLTTPEIIWEEMNN